MTYSTTKPNELVTVRTFTIPDPQSPHPDASPAFTGYTVAPFLSPLVVPTPDLMRVAHHPVMEGGRRVIKTTIDGNLLGTYEDYGEAEAAACLALVRGVACLGCGDYSLPEYCPACLEDQHMAPVAESVEG